MFKALENWYIHVWLGIPPAVDGPLAAKQPVAKKPEAKRDYGVKFTERGIPYREIPPEEKEDRAWVILNTGEVRPDTASAESVNAATAAGFASDTVLAIYRLWKEKHSQSEIAAATGFSTSTVKKITRHFKPGSK